MHINRRQFLQLATGSIAALPTIAWPQAYPSRPVRLFVPYAPGGPTDILARLLAQKLSDQLGNPFFVENIVGAGGNIGMARGAKAAPDGHALIIVPPNIVVNPALYGTVPYDPFRDFDPVTIAVTSTIALAVHPSLAVNSVKDLVALIKANPTKYGFASPGNGTPPHLVGEHFRQSLGLDLAHIPFNGAGPAVASTVGGHTPILFCSVPPLAPQVREGRLRALAITSNARSQALPNVPTMAEAGYPDITGEGWFAFIVPAGTPKEITMTLQREIVKAIAQPDIKERAAALGFEPVGSTPDEAAAQFRSESARWTKVIRAAGLKAE
jgi:tripartite-type tricarboxylate transporter receptor subunit TctC